MSIILKALKSSEGEQKNQTNFNYKKLPEGEGFFRGKQSFIKKSSPVDLGVKASKRVYYLAAILVVLVAVSFIAKRVREQPPSPQVEVATEAPAAAPAEAQPPQIDAPAEAAKAFETGDYDASVRYFREAIEADPMNSKLHNNLGLAFLKKELYSSAEDEYKKALEYDTSCSECFNNLGMLKSLLGESVEAKKYLEKAISLSSAYPDPYFNLAVLSEKEGDFSSAIKYYRQFTNIYPDKDSALVSKINRRVDELAGN